MVTLLSRFDGGWPPCGAELKDGTVLFTFNNEPALTRKASQGSTEQEGTAATAAAPTEETAWPPGHSAGGAQLPPDADDAAEAPAQTTNAAEAAMDQTDPDTSASAPPTDAADSAAAAETAAAPAAAETPAAETAPHPAVIQRLSSLTVRAPSGCPGCTR